MTATMIDVSVSPYVAGHSERRIAAAIGISRCTVAKYLRRATVVGITWPVPAELDDAALEAQLFSRRAMLLDVADAPAPQQRLSPSWLFTTTLHKLEQTQTGPTRPVPVTFDAAAIAPERPSSSDIGTAGSASGDACAGHARRPAARENVAELIERTHPHRGRGLSRRRHDAARHA